MDVLIENYRGFDINYSTTREEFSCVITDEAKKEGNYLSSIKRFVDEYKKANSAFAPFDVMDNPASIYGNGKTGKIIGVRKDGKFIIESSNGKQSQIALYSEKDYILALPENEKGLRELAELEKEREEIRLEMNLRRGKIVSSLKIITLADFKKTLI